MERGTSSFRSPWEQYPTAPPKKGLTVQDLTGPDGVVTVMAYLLTQHMQEGGEVTDAVFEIVELLSQQIVDDLKEKIK